MDAMKAKLACPKEDVGPLVHGSDWDSESVADLGKLLSNNLRTCFHTAIKKITESGYCQEAAEHVVLRCGPFYGTKDVVSIIVERALYCLRTKGCANATFFSFDNLESLVQFMTLEMVTMLEEVKPWLSVREAIWTLLLCDLNLFEASDVNVDHLKFSINGGKAVQGEGTSAEADIPSESESQDQETMASNVKNPDALKSSKTNPQNSTSGKRCEDTRPNCRNCCSTIANRRNPLRQTETRTPKGVMKRNVVAVGDLVSDNKQSPSGSSSVNKKNPTVPLKETTKVTPKPKTVPPEPPKSVDHYLVSIPYDESKGKHVPQDDRDRLILTAVAEVQSLQKEVQTWDDWANLKVMEVAKKLGHHRSELKKLRAEEEAEKLKKDEREKEECTKKRLLEMDAALNTANYQIKMASSAVVRLDKEKAVLKREMEIAITRSSHAAKNLEQALRKEQEALKKSQSFGSDKNEIEEELRVLKREAASRQHDLVKAKDLLKQTEIRLENEKRETDKFVKQAESIKNERERLEALAKADEEMMIENAEKDSKMYENETKRIQYEISASKLEQETKKITGMRTGLNWQPTKRLEVFRNISQMKDRECVMCMEEEKTVVLLPCSHQVLCADCNVVHEEKGMNECPSCRTPIQKRINARFAKP